MVIGGYQYVGISAKNEAASPSTEMKTAGFSPPFESCISKAWPSEMSRAPPRWNSKSTDPRLPGQGNTFWREGWNSQLAVEVTAISRTRFPRKNVSIQPPRWQTRQCETSIMLSIRGDAVLICLPRQRTRERPLMPAFTKD